MKRERWRDDRGSIAVLSAADRDLLYNRWLEAADVLLRLPPVRYPKQFGNSMPEVVRDYADAMGAEESRDKSEWAWRIRREPAPAAAISRMEEVTEWSVKYLMDWPRHRRCAPRDCLWASAICAMSRRSFAGVCRKRGWARTTAYARIDHALALVCNGLVSDGLEMRPSPIDYVEQFEQYSPRKTVV